MKHTGLRYGGVKDPAGNVWYPTVETEFVPIDEVQRRIHEIGL